MSFSIPKADLTPEQTKLIVKNLVFVPKKKQFSKNNFQLPDDPITFYELKNSRVYIPFAYAANLFKIWPGLDKKYTISKFDFIGEARENQFSAIEKSKKFLDEKGSCILSIPPGAGKTFIGAYLAHTKKLLTLVVHVRVKLGHQWKTTFDKFTTAVSWIVGEEIPDKPIDVIICINSRFCKIPDNIRSQIGFVIYDEAHLLCTRENKDIFFGIEPRYVVAETATLKRTDEMDIMIRCVCGNQIVDDFEKKRFILVRCKTGINPTVEKTQQETTNWSVLTKSLYDNSERNDMILGIILANPGKKSLILTSMVNHALHLVELVKSVGKSVDYLAGKKENYSESEVLVGTVSKIGTGFDEGSSCENFSGNPINLVILAITYDNPAVYAQNFGRGFRSDNPVAYLLIDNSPIMTRHWSKAKKWALEENGEIYTRKFVKKDKVYELE